MANNMVAHRSLSSNGVLLRNGGQNDHRNIRDRQTMHRTIIKQGYLKKLPNAAKLGASLKKVERRWFVFGIIGRTDPYLEYYENEESIFGSRPLNIVFLDSCHHITRNQKTTRFCNIFTLVLKDRLLSLVAPTRDAMFEWSRAIEEKLCNLGIIESTHGPGHNDYIRMPMRLQRHSFHELASHGHNQEEAPVRNQERVYLDVQASGGPSFPAVHAVEHEPVPPSQGRSTVEPFYENFPRNQEAEGLMEDTYFLTSSSTCGEDVYVAAAPESENIYTNSARPGIADDEADVSNSRSADTRTPDAQCSSVSDLVAFERDFGASSESFSAAPPAERPSSAVSDETSRLSASLRNSLLDVEPAGSHRHEMNPVALPSYDEAVSSPNLLNGDFAQYCRLRPPSVALPPVSYSRVIPRSSAVEPLSSNAPVASARSDGGGHGLTLPPPYSSRKVPLSVGANVPLKEAQLQKLVQEMNDSRGISVMIPMAQCQGTIAFVECFNQIWIGGWNQRLCPTFHSLLHIGDQLISVNDVTPSSAQMAKKLVKTCSGKMDAKLTIRRIPSGRAFGLSRASGSSNSLGLTMINKTAEIGLVDPTGLARENGLEEKAPAMNGAGGEGGSWWVTEVNNQPLNLFFKDDEAKQRLNAVGSHISFVVQPTQLVVEIKKQLKNLKGFRDFLVN